MPIYWSFFTSHIKNIYIQYSFKMGLYNWNKFVFYTMFFIKEFIKFINT